MTTKKHALVPAAASVALVAGLGVAVAATAQAASTVVVPATGGTEMVSGLLSPATFQTELNRAIEEKAAADNAAMAAAMQAQAAATPAAAAGDSGNYGDSASWAASAKAQSVIMCESTGNYQINTGNGYYGAWQFNYSTWHSNGGGQFAEYPHQATKAQQDYIAWKTWQSRGWQPWQCA